jgi:hypothetical protein
VGTTAEGLDPRQSKRPAPFSVAQHPRGKPGARRKFINWRADAQVRKNPALKLRLREASAEHARSASRPFSCSTALHGRRTSGLRL